MCWLSEAWWGESLLTHTFDFVTKQITKSKQRTHPLSFHSNHSLSCLLCMLEAKSDVCQCSLMSFDWTRHHRQRVSRLVYHWNTQCYLYWFIIFSVGVNIMASEVSNLVQLMVLGVQDLWQTYSIFSRSLPALRSFCWMSSYLVGSCPCLLKNDWASWRMQKSLRTAAEMSSSFIS